MAAKIHGQLAAVQVNSASPTTIYQTPSGRKATFTVSITKIAGTDPIALALVNGAVGAVASRHYIEASTTLAANAVLERTGITQSAGHTVVGHLASGSSSTVNYVVWGIEEDV